MYFAASLYCSSAPSFSALHRASKCRACEVVHVLSTQCAVVHASVRACKSMHVPWMSMWQPVKNASDGQAIDWTQRLHATYSFNSCGVGTCNVHSTGTNINCSPASISSAAHTPRSPPGNSRNKSNLGDMKPPRERSHSESGSAIEA